MSDPKILLYYAFAPIADPDAVRLWQRELCESLGLRGRIIVSKHGINGTVGGEIDACKRYLRRTREYGPFKGLDVKWSDGTGYIATEANMLKGEDRSVPWKRIADFPKLSVKVRDELVAFGIPEETKVDAAGVIGGGTHLSPRAVNELVAERGDEVVFFDGRNAWEAEIGRFKGAVVPEDRSMMNVPFITGDADMDAAVVSASKAVGFDNLKGHKSVGGLRASIYNAMPEEGVVALVDFLKKFEAEHK